MEIFKKRKPSEFLELAGSLTCGLTVFEVVRNPRMADKFEYQNLQTSLNESGLRDEISCAICSGIVHKCVVIKTCLHRFCSSCIEKCVRIGLRECPKCRKHVPSRRFLKPDPIYDSIISRLIPNVKVFEELSDTIIMAINKGMKNDSTIEAIRSKFFNEDSKISIDSLNSVDESFNLREFSVTSIFDSKLYIKEIKQRRKAVLDSLPKTPPFDKLPYRLIAESNLPQVIPDLIYGDGTITLNHLSSYIKTMLDLPIDLKLLLRIKEKSSIPPPTATMNYLRNVACILSHETLSIYYSAETNN
ncbi:hypothetical protein BEWA_010870 [Theileria equi strain WA]|uniref:RING-type domain-containing protein n=1 Tax=Theileria equi strain WA TaxID=1537102 RepID=L0B1G3_THEEQ|nr:hypothetical protein BEWA_010870 [Theileria equi strain WA]AFZ81670.1 hypothetical protein BEWA_010870 [Theileria equi strain WA]|eukprot:XP_004831336.1 hypothetical protein BEWA_010870 [Theileria equi strain WA]